MKPKALSTRVFAQPGRILVVDDDQSILAVMSEVLGHDLHTVMTASDGAAALRAIEVDSLDLVILDVRLPDIDGLEICRRTKANPSLQHIPIILMTAYGDDDIHVHGLECGANDFLRKPIDSAVLLARVRALLKYRRAVQALQKSNRGLVEANARLLALQKSREEMSRVILHDLKNPLAVIQGNVRLAMMFAKGQWPPKQLRGLAQTDQACEKLLKLLSNIRDLYRLEDKEAPLTRCRIEGEALAEKAVRGVSAYAEVQEKRAVAQARPDLPPVMADAQLVVRALEILLIRVIDDTPSGGEIVLRTERHPEDSGVRFSVTYPGPPTYFGTLDPEKDTVALETPVKGDRGMALTFCQLVGEGHGGEFSIERDPEFTRQCRFVLSLPAGQG